MDTQRKQEEKGNRSRHLRNAAEEKLARSSGASPEMKKKTLEELVHELQVQQIELEMQNEELKKAQLALEASRDKYVDLYDFAPAGYFTFTHGALVTEVNLTGAALLGVARQKLINSRFRRFVAPEDVERWDRHIVSVLQQGKKQSCELVLKREDGSTFHARLDSIRLDLPDGQEKAGVSGGTPVVRTAVNDITERKQAEEALKQSEKKYQDLYNNAPTMLVSVDHGTGRVVECNNTLLKRTGFEKSEVIGGHIFERYHPDCIEKAKVAFNQFLKHGEVKDTELELRTILGGKIPVLLNVSSVRDEKENILYSRLVWHDITGRKRAEEGLKQSEERYRAVAESAIDSIITIDEAGIIIGWNQGAEHTFGFNETEILGQSLGILMPESYRNAHTVGLNRLQKGGEPRVIGRTVELEGKRKDGSEFPLELSLAQWETTEGRFFTGIIRNITERKRAEETLRENKEKYRELVESISDVIYEIDERGKFTYVSPVTRDVLGYEPEDLVGRGFTEFVHPEDRDLLVRRFSELTQGIEYPLEYRVMAKSGEVRWVRTRTKPMMKGTAFSGARGTLIDITTRKQAEEALRGSEEKYRTILEDIEEGYFEVNIAGNFTFFNDSLSRLLGYSRDEMMGMNNRQYTDGENARKLYQAFNRVYRTREPTKEFDWEIIRKDGTKRYIETSVSSIKNSSGQPIGFRGVVRDITERKRVEKEMATLQEQFRQSQKMEAIGRLAGGIAHDFNNLLTIIKGYSQLSLLELKEGDPLRGNIDSTQKATERAANLIRQLLAFSRCQVMEMNVLDLNTLLRDLEKMLRRLIGEDIGLVNILAEDLGKVKADPGQIEQVILNLAVNARDAMPNGGKLTIETANVELDEAYTRAHIAVTPGRYVMLSVSDTGVGMTPKVKERIFEPFFSTKEKGKGTGLGLSTVYGIVKQSGGNVWVYSELGMGTTFKIYFPRLDELLEKLPEKVRVEEIRRGSETILIVEDEEEVRKVAVRMLEKQGYTVLEARQEEEALLFCEQRKEPIHLILTDVVMPQMSGPQLIDRSRQVRQDFKVLYMSGYTDNTIVHHGVLEKGIDYIQKPFSMEELARKVREVLDK